ncbi:DNA polymerase theta [Papilio machaon]|uniref:DNA polymerase theta n=1 Tax=Papilio machaon TaxID=76193 RepID=UPI001E663964|nr:DNA polymerase theta [Papilio machaon]
MAATNKDVIDSQILVENVSFLENCFDNSFSIHNSLVTVRDYITQTVHLAERNNKNIKSNTEKKSVSNLELSLTTKGVKKAENNINVRKLMNWGLPFEITKKYEDKGIKEMFEWQVSCLSQSNVLLEHRNLVYSAPTSAGKTLVAEILTIKTILERQKKVLFILPFVSIVREKMFYLQDILSSSGIRVEGFMGSQSPPGGLQAVHVAICTIEKANSLVNRLIDEGNISELGAVVVDELHLLGDSSRGYILELLLTKIKYISLKANDVNIQIVGMSATLPNLEVLAAWLDAELFITDFRPIPLEEYCLVGKKLYDKKGTYLRSIGNNTGLENENESVLDICLDTIKEGCSVLIFCMTKNRCESLAQSIASTFFKLGCTNNEIGTVLRNQLNKEKIAEVLEQLKNCPVGLDEILKNIVSFGVAYHHAGLTFDERDIIEGAFKSGAIRVLVATSTLSSGVNLPARKVIIRTPVFQRQPLNILTYKQMIGRAGRMGRDVKGESILICTEAEKKIGQELMIGVLNPVKSCIESEDRYMRAVLEIIASQVTCTESELNLYTKCSLLFNQEKKIQSQMLLLGETLDKLKNYELIRVQDDGNEIQYVATSLGKACLSSSMAPNDGLSLFCELQKARQCIVLENDLHLIYLVTPYSVSSQWNDIDWLHLLTLWESLTRAMKKVGELIGIQESFIIQRLRGSNHTKIDQKKLNIHKRFYTALALQDLVNEVPLSQVAEKFQCPRGFLQGLQQAAATFAGMVTAFCHQLGWKNMELLISQFQDRLHFGIHSELIELMKLTSLNGIRARALFDKGFETISSIASADVNTIENILLKAVPFQSEKEIDGDDQCDLKKRNKIKNIWITGCCGMTAKEAALNLILEARKYLQEEIGVTEIKWNELENKTICNDKSSNSHCKNFSNSQQNRNLIIGTNGHIVPENLSTKKQSNLQAINGIVTDNENNDQKLMNNGSLLSYKEDLIKDNVERTANSKHSTQEKKSSRKEKIDQDCIEIKDSPIINNINFARTDSPSILKDDIVWESLDFSTALNNISKLRASDKIMSPEISFGDNELIVGTPENANENKLLKDVSTKDASTKDVSLFSSDESGSSFFDETLPIDLLPSTFSNSEDSNKNTSLNDVTIDCQSILNAFTSSIAMAEDDDDIKLIYEEDKKEQKSGNVNISQAVEIINSQDAVKIWDYKSPLKRPSHKLNQPQQPLKRMKKNIDDKNFQINNLKCNRSKKLSIEIRQKIINCYILREIDLIEYLDEIKSWCNVSLYLDINESKSTNEVIGSSIFKNSDVMQKGKVVHNFDALKGIALCLSNDLCVYFDFNSVTEILHEIKKKMSYWLNKDSLNLNLLSLTTTYVHLKRSLSVNLTTNCTDLSLTEWLIESDEKIADVNYLMRKYCDIDLSTELLKIGNAQKNFKNSDCIEKALLKAWCIQCLGEKQKEFLFKQYQDINIIANVETHVARILANCEYHGLGVDRDLAAKLLIDVKNTQEILMKKAYKICGYHFNFNSSKDVAKVLGFYKGRRVSTKKSVLTAHNSPLATVVIYWRKLNAILTKTLYPLTEKASSYSTADRINPSYTMHTCTGRITMREPNLQNVPRTFSIPVKYLTLTNENDLSTDVIEFNCRNVFIATPGCVFVSADYCQLELRILTHYSCDPVLTKIMRSDVDVFKAIAASWSCLPEEEVDDDLRQKAKQLCYGILYGMGNKTLSQHLYVTEVEAAVFMDTFYKTYPSLKTFIQSIIDACREHGYVETLKKRRRYLPDIKSNLPHKRSAAERQAVNTTIQGSAADIAKAAMCAVDKTHFSYIKPRLILQLHDELIYEVQETHMKDFSKVLKRVLEDTVCLNVPLPVKLKSGKTWGTLSEIKV